MSLLARQQDSQVAYEDAIVPGSTILGTARTDPFAVALPLEKAADSSIRALADSPRRATRGAGALRGERSRSALKVLLRAHSPAKTSTAQ
jgi:hypothetical protein